MQEIWKTIEEFPKYEISNKGIVRNIKNKKIKSQRIHQNRIIIRFRKNNKEYERFLSRLLALSFLYNDTPLEKTQVNHIDENTFNNNLSNLEWCTSKENLNHGTRSKRSSISNSKTIYQYTIDGKLVKKYSQVKQVEKDGFSMISVAAVANGYQKTNKGYKWSYEKLH